MNLTYRPGMRAFKSAAAVFVSLLVTWLLKRPTPFFAAIAAVVCTQQDIEQTAKSGMGRFLGTCIGGAVGFLALQLLLAIPHFVDGVYVVLIPFAVLLCIYLCNLLEQQNSIPICCIVLLNVVLHYDRGMSGSGWYVINRVIDTFLGVLSAYAVNRWTPRPKLFKKEESTLKSL